MTRARGFTLLEVMIALTILAMGLVVLLRISTSDVRASHRAKLLTIATGLAQAKMYDLEEELMRVGFQDMGETVNGDFSEEQQPKFTWEATIEKVVLPQAGEAAAEASSSKTTAARPDPNDAANQDQLSALAGGSSSGALGASMVQMYFPLIAPVLENAIRKVTLTIHWKIGSDEESLKVICFFTDTKAIDQAMHLPPGGAPAPTPPAGTPPARTN